MIEGTIYSGEELILAIKNGKLLTFVEFDNVTYGIEYKDEHIRPSGSENE